MPDMVSECCLWHVVAARVPSLKKKKKLIFLSLPFLKKSNSFSHLPPVPHGPIWARNLPNSSPQQTLLPLFEMSLPISLLLTIFPHFLRPTQISTSLCGTLLGFPWTDLVVLCSVFLRCVSHISTIVPFHWGSKFIPTYLTSLWTWQ